MKRKVNEKMNQETSLAEQVAQQVFEKGEGNGTESEYRLQSSLPDGRNYTLLFRPGAGIGNERELGNPRLLELHINPSKLDQIGYAVGEVGKVDELGVEKGISGMLYQFSIIAFPDRHLLIYSEKDGVPYNRFVAEKRQESLELVLNAITAGEQ